MIHHDPPLHHGFRKLSLHKGHMEWEMMIHMDLVDCMDLGLDQEKRGEA
jgi:hypothetical protein